jgi:hypothetical protein
MPGLKVTREVHAKVRHSLKTMSITQAAKRHRLSPQTVSRIKRGGNSYVGFKRELTADHVSLTSEIWGKPSSTVASFMEEPEAVQPGFFSKLKRKVVRR